MKKLRLAVIALVMSLFANILCILPYVDGYYERIKEYITLHNISPQVRLI